MNDPSGPREGSRLLADEPVLAKPDALDDYVDGHGQPRGESAPERAAGASEVPSTMEAHETPHDAEMRESADVQDEPATAMDLGFIGSLEPEPFDVVSELLLQQLGSTGNSYRREARKAFRGMVSEIYSPPRVTAELRRRPRRHLLPGFALDLTVIDPDDGQPWDFCCREKREKARAMRRRTQPLLLI